METNQPSDKDVRVDRYVQSEMTGAEKEAFEKEMLADDGLRQEVSLRRALLDGIRKNQNDALRSRLNVIHNEVQNASAEQSHVNIGSAGQNRSRWWLAAAASVVLIMAFTLWMSGLFDTSSENLYSQYYEKPAYSGTRGTGDNTLSEAGNMYNTDRFEDAAYRFEDYLRGHEDDTYVRFMAAISYLESDDLKNAKAHLKEVIESDGPLSTRAEWYLALTYLKEDNRQEAIFWLKRLAGDPSAKPYSDKALGLLEKLD